MTNTIGNASLTDREANKLSNGTAVIVTKEGRFHTGAICRDHHENTCIRPDGDDSEFSLWAVSTCICLGYTITLADPQHQAEINAQRELDALRAQAAQKLAGMSVDQLRAFIEE